MALTTDEDGLFLDNLVPPGKYCIHIHHNDYAVLKKRGIELQAGDALDGLVYHLEPATRIVELPLPKGKNLPSSFYDEVSPDQEYLYLRSRRTNDSILLAGYPGGTSMKGKLPFHIIASTFVLCGLFLSPLMAFDRKGSSDETFDDDPESHALYDKMVETLRDTRSLKPGTASAKGTPKRSSRNWDSDKHP